jgi:hypothetical protein
MMEYEKQDFDGLMLTDIYSLSDGDNALEKYPVLKKYPEFNIERKDFNKILRYISFMYDSKTPLHVITNVSARKVEAATLAGFEKNAAGRFSEDIELVLSCNDSEVVSMIMRYIRMHKNADFSQFVVYDESYHRQLEKMFTDDVSNAEKTKDFFQNTNNLKKEIVNLSSILLNQDTSKGLVDSFYDSVEEEQLMIRPELMAKLLGEKGSDAAKKYLK